MSILNIKYTEMTMTITNEFLKCEINYILDDNNSPWFCGKAIGVALGYTNHRKALKDHVDDDDKEKLTNLRGNESLPLSVNQKNSIYVNESGLYSLIMSSKSGSISRPKQPPILSIFLVSTTARIFILI